MRTCVLPHLTKYFKSRYFPSINNSFKVMMGHVFKAYCALRIERNILTDYLQHFVIKVSCLYAFQNQLGWAFVENAWQIVDYFGRRTLLLRANLNSVHLRTCLFWRVCALHEALPWLIDYFLWFCEASIVLAVTGNFNYLLSFIKLYNIKKVRMLLQQNLPIPHSYLKTFVTWNLPKSKKHSAPSSF